MTSFIQFDVKSLLGSLNVKFKRIESFKHKTYKKKHAKTLKRKRRSRKRIRVTSNAEHDTTSEIKDKTSFVEQKDTVSFNYFFYFIAESHFKKKYLRKQGMTR